MRVLLSIRPPHAENILEGKKVYEFRRKVFSRRDVKTILIYATKPVGRFVGEFDIEDILEDDPEALWETTSHGSGITKCYFDGYFAGRTRAFALRIGAVRPFDEPIDPRQVFEDFTAPQSFMYVQGAGADIRRVGQPMLL